MLRTLACHAAAPLTGLFGIDDALLIEIIFGAFSAMKNCHQSANQGTGSGLDMVKQAKATIAANTNLDGKINEDLLKRCRHSVHISSRHHRVRFSDEQADEISQSMLTTVAATDNDVAVQCYYEG